MPPFALPVDVALARPIERLPDSAGVDVLQGKIDGWRAIVATGPRAQVFSRHGKDLTKAFSDIAAAAALLPPAVLDGELIAVTASGELSFTLLQTRSGKGPRPGAGFAVQLACFDLLALGNDLDTRPLPYVERNDRLVELLTAAPPELRPLPVTDDLAHARSWVGELGGGIEGLLLKPATSRYLPGYASGWRKWRRRSTVDAVVVGVTAAVNPNQQAAVLAQPDAAGRLRPVGVSLPLPAALRAELAPLLRPLGGDLVELPGVVGGLPGSAPIHYLPVEPDVVVEILVDQPRPEFGRFRHRPRVARVRAELQPEYLRPLPGLRADG